MQLSVFSTDNHKSGFRLQYMEVFNWGTFDQHVHSIRPMGETSLLTGANGSGKTTFIDALLTLMVPEKKYRFYNQSSGSERKGDRTEESYVLGGYSMVKNELSGTDKTLYLRASREETYSILLASFANETDQEVTLFQVRYFSGGEMKKIFGIAHKALQIETDFTPFDLQGNWRRRMDAQYNKGMRRNGVEWFDAASKYAQRMVEVLGMQSIQAISLFNQTVGIKVLGNLDEFIRTNMLEPRNMEEKYQELKKHLGTLLEARRNIEKVEEQIRLLLPLQQHYLAFTRQSDLLQEAREEMETAKIWNSYTRHRLLQEAIQEGREKEVAWKRELDTLLFQIDSLLERERQTKNQLEHNKAGQRLRQLEKDIRELAEELRKARKQLSDFCDWCKTLQLSETEVPDEAAYKRVKSEANKAKLRMEREQRLNEEDEFEAKNAKLYAEKEKAEIELEWNLLLQGKNNIPGHLVQMREEICQALKIEVHEIPFAGELMQVRPEEMHWQPALEKLLHGFALRLLVPDRHYKKVNRFVNNTNLRNRLVYYQVADVNLLSAPDEGTVFDKLDFHPDHALASWVEYQVIREFNYVCLENEVTLDRYDKAITLGGLIKNRDRHEKDDRPARNDPGQYVMGWNNEKKKEYLQRYRAQTVEIIEKAKETLQRCSRKNAKLQNQIYAQSRIQDHDGFAMIDISGIQRRIHQAEEQMQQLKESSDQLQALTLQLEELQRDRAGKESARSELERRLAVAENEQQQRVQQLNGLQELLQHLSEEDKDRLLQFQQRHSGLFSGLTLAALDSVYQHFRKETEENINRLREAVHREELELNRCIRSIRHPSFELQKRFPDWSGDVHQFADEGSFAYEYSEWLEKLQTENLPRYKKDFERYLHETVVYKIGEWNEELESWELKIKNSIQTLNQSLSGINFNRLPDTYIQLGLRAIPDTIIKEFRHRLLGALPNAANWQQSPFEEKAAHFHERVQPLLQSLEESESYRARVLDVRNWFEFWADEIYRQTGELKKTYRQMGQLSGGEKAQLTYTILCSAIAYQFGITREGKNPRSLRFIAVDESFSNQDEEKATYLMELCRQLHLQLLVVTPSDKIQIVQNFIAHVHLVQRVSNRHSILFNMTIKELKDKVREVQNDAVG